MPLQNLKFASFCARGNFFLRKFAPVDCIKLILLLISPSNSEYKEGINSEIGLVLDQSSRSNSSSSTVRFESSWNVVMTPFWKKSPTTFLSFAVMKDMPHLSISCTLVRTQNVTVPNSPSLFQSPSRHGLLLKMACSQRTLYGRSEGMDAQTR